MEYNFMLSKQLEGSECFEFHTLENLQKNV